MPQMLTVTAWATSLGISRQAGHQAIKRCGIPVTDGKVDAEVATMLYRSRTRTRTNEPRETNDAPLASGGKPTAKADDSGDDYWGSRARREKAEAALAELKLAEAQGELVRAADVRAAHSKRLAALREAMLQIPARLSPVLAAESDQQRCFDVLQRELHGLLAQMVQA